jgi:hypothetical protein
VGFACGANTEKRKACRLLVEKTERKRSLRRPRHRCVNKIKMDFLQIGGVVRTQLI